MYPDISISLKVVNMALVFWASFNLSAILSLILFIGTLVSVLVPLIVVGAFLAVLDAAFFGAAGGGVDGALAATGAAGAGVAGAAAYNLNTVIF